jgi:5-methyltetrahydrofolate--homocysteine methyltransferase
MVFIGGKRILIIIGEKINGSVPSVAKAIAEKDGDFIGNLAKAQADAGANFIDVCASLITILNLKP